MDYHLSIAGATTGPHSQLRLIERIREGELKGDELVWYKGLPEWKPLKDIEDFAGYWPPPPEAPVKAESAREAARTQPDRPQPWMRFWARMVDYLWFSATLGLLVHAFLPPEVQDWLRNSQSLSTPVNSLTFLLYVPLEAWLLSRSGTTPGRALLRIQVRRLDGGLPTWRQAVARSFQVWVKGVALCLPFVMLFAMAWWRVRLVQKGVTGWDERCETKVEHGEPEMWRFIVLAAIMVFMALAAGLAFVATKEIADAMRSLPK